MKSSSSKIFFQDAFTFDPSAALRIRRFQPQKLTFYVASARPCPFLIFSAPPAAEGPYSRHGLLKVIVTA